MEFVEIPIASGIFLALFGASLVGYVRGRSPLAGRVVVMFGAVSILFANRMLDWLFGWTLPQPLPLVALLGVLAQPFLTLRVAEMLERVPRWAVAAAGAGYVATALPLVLLADARPTALVVAAVAVYVVTALAAAAYFFRAAQRRVASARLRLLIASAATVVMALTLLLAGAGSVVPGAGAIADMAGRYGAVLAGLGYGVAFLTPRWLRNLWQSSTGYKLSRLLLESSHDTNPGETWQRFAELARRAAGVDHALVAVGGPTEGGRVVAAVGDFASSVGPWDGPRFAALLESADAVHQRSVRELPGDVAGMLGAGESGYVTLLSFPAPGGESAVLALAGERRSLFVRDDQEMFRTLGIQAALLADRAAASARQIALADQLTSTVDALRRAHQAKSDFLASMSHELRTPLNAVLGFSDLMRSEPGADGRRSVPEEWIAHVHGAGQHLLGLINDVLDLAKVEAGRLEIRREPVEVDAAVAEALGGLRPLAEKKQLRLSSTVRLPALLVDRGRLRQILYNLLSNAIKYTPEGGEVRVEGTVDSAGVRLTVADTGVGIALEDSDRVFEEFTQVGDPATQQPGTGLGLALTRRLVEAHGGRLELESAVGSGSRFTVVLPVSSIHDSSAVPADGSPEEQGVRAGPRTTSDRPLVLVIEDDPQAVVLLRSYLEPSGYRMRAVTSGEAGLAAATTEQPAAILLDVLLPDVDGWQVLRRLKADSKSRDIPVLMITVVDERDVGMALGAADYLVKPVERAGLLSALSRHVPVASERRSRVLAIDDDPATRDMLAQVLGSAGCEVVLAAGGDQALAAFEASDFDLVICDLVMPGMDGFQVVAELNARGGAQRVPILILTSHRLTETDRDRLNGHIVGICEKGDDAFARLRTWLGGVTGAPAEPAVT